MEAVGTPPGTPAASQSQGSAPGQSQPMDVSQPTEQSEQETASQSLAQPHSQEPPSVDTAQSQSAEQPATDGSQPGASAEEALTEKQRLRQDRSDKLT